MFLFSTKVSQCIFCCYTCSDTKNSTFETYFHLLGSTSPGFGLTTCTKVLTKLEGKVPSHYVLKKPFGFTRIAVEVLLLCSAMYKTWRTGLPPECCCLENHVWSFRRKMAPYENKLELFANSARGKFIKIQSNPCSDGMKMEDRSLAGLPEKSRPKLSFLSTDTARKPSLDGTRAEFGLGLWELWSGAADHRTTEGFAWEGF